MKKIIAGVLIVLILIAAGLLWFFYGQDKEATIEDALVIAKATTECADVGTFPGTGSYVDYYDIWYVDIEQDEDINFVYSCEVTMYSQTARLIVEQAFNWYESDFEEYEEEPDNVLGNEETALTVDEAGLIALSSECAEQGDLLGTGIYNDNTSTWWLDLDMRPAHEKEGCNPACVVGDVTMTAEINWRCTGLIVE